MPEPDIRPVAPEMGTEPELDDESLDEDLSGVDDSLEPEDW